MWGILVGLPLGLLQLIGVMKFSAMVTGGGFKKSAVGYIIGNALLLIGVFILMALISADYLLWTATGMVAFMIVASVVIYIKKMKSGR